jgi:hypothetical protein
MSKLNKYKFLIIFVLIFAYSCKENITQPGVINIDVSQARPGRLSEIVDSISYIQLETTDECLIASIVLMKYHDRHYYIHDLPAKTIFIFSETGKYVNKLCKYGQGAGEYLGIYDFTIDSDNRIHVLDLGKKQILVYDSSCEFLSKIDIDKNEYPYNLFCLGDNYVLYMPDAYMGVRLGAYVFDPEQNTYTQILQFDKWDKELNRSPNTLLIEKTNLEYSLINTCSDIIYNMKGSELVNKFQFDIKPRQRIDGYTFTDCNETDNIINVSWGYWKTVSGESDHIISCFYDKNTQALKIFRGITNDIDEKYGWPWSLNNQFVIVISGELDETGFELNPALQIWHLKNLNEMP